MGGIKVGDFQISFFFQIYIKSPGNTSRSKSSLKELLWCLLGKALSFFYQNIAAADNDWKVLFPGEEDVHFYFLVQIDDYFQANVFK